MIRNLVSSFNIFFSVPNTVSVIRQTCEQVETLLAKAGCVNGQCPPLIYQLVCVPHRSSTEKEPLLKGNMITAATMPCVAPSRCADIAHGTLTIQRLERFS